MISSFIKSYPLKKAIQTYPPRKAEVSFTSPTQVWVLPERLNQEIS